MKITAAGAGAASFLDGSNSLYILILFIFFILGDATAPVADCSRVEYNAHSKLEMTVKDFVDYWQDYGARSYDKKERCLYLKDWHFTRFIEIYIDIN